MSRMYWIPIWLSASVVIAIVLGLASKALDRYEDWRQRRKDARFVEDLRRRKTDASFGGRS